MPYQYVIRYAEYSAPSTYYYIASNYPTNTASTDTPASTPIYGGLRPLNFSVSIFDGIDPRPTPKGGFGSIIIDDPGGDRDYLIGKVMSGGTLTVLRGTPGAAISTFTAVATMTTAGMQYDQDKKEIRLRDFGWFLEAPLHDNRYGGTGSADGDATVTGIIKPYGAGTIFNASPVLINATNLIYQLSDGAIYAVADLRNGGASWTFGTDRANYAAMAASAPPSGAYYDTCLSEGLIRLGATPDRDITVDFTGDTNGGTPYVKRGNIAQRIATRTGTTVSVNSTALTALNTAQAADTNFWWNQEITKAAALTEIMQGCLGYWYINMSGELVLGSLVAPSGSALATYTFPNDFVGNPEALDTAADPRWKTTLGYKRNYTVQEQSRLAGASIVSLNIADGSAEAVYYVVCPRAGKIRRIWTVIDGAVSTADITITAAIGATAVTNGVVTITQSGSAAGDIDSATPTANNTVSAGQAVNFTVTGGGSGGSPRIQLLMEIESPVTASNAQLYGQEAQWVTASTSNQRTYWPTAPEVKLLSGYTGSSDASTEASRQQTIFQGIPAGSRMLERIKVKIAADPFTLAGYLGGVISIASYPRYSWANPRKFIVIGVTFNGDAWTEVTLWG